MEVVPAAGASGSVASSVTLVPVTLLTINWTGSGWGVGLGGTGSPVGTGPLLARAAEEMQASRIAAALKLPMSPSFSEWHPKSGSSEGFLEKIAGVQEPESRFASTRLPPTGYGLLATSFG